MQQGLTINIESTILEYFFQILECAGLRDSGSALIFVCMNIVNMFVFISFGGPLCNRYVICSY